MSDKTIYNWLRGQVAAQVSYRKYKRVMKENEDLKKILGVLTLELEKTKKDVQKQLGKLAKSTRNQTRSSLLPL